MNNEFVEILFEDLVSKDKGFLRGPFGGSLKKEIFVPKGDNTYKVYEQGVVLRKDIRIGDYYIEGEYFDNKMYRFEVCPKDFLVSCSGVNYGAIYQMPDNIEKGIINQALLRIRLNNDLIDDKYFGYFFEHHLVNQIIGKKGDSTIPNFPPVSVLKKLNARIHSSIQYQKQIAKVLSDLDAKIEVNNKINQELEAITKTIYDYWFVQFDFPDKNGKPYKSSGGKMVYNEELKREIPEGWECHFLGDLGNFKNGVNYDPSNPGKIACPIINVRNISASSYFLKNEDLDIIYLDESDVRKYSVHEDSIIIARSGIPGATRLIADFLKNTLYCGFAIHYQLENTNNKLPIFFYLKSVEQVIKEGSGGTILKNVNQATLNGLKVTLPNSENIIESFNKKINPMFKKINLIQKENQKLATLRDWLLPMLMNGQVTVGEAKEQINTTAEPGTIYKKDKTSLDSLFNSINYDYEVATVVLLTRQILNRTFGKKYIHKMFSNIQFLESLPVFEDLEFQENGWGMYCPILTKTIANKKFIVFEDVNDDMSVINFNYKHIKEVSNWINAEKNQEFVSQVKHMLNIYQKSLISKDMNRIELLNTVLECMNVLETDSFDAIYTKMENWQMYEEGYKNKAEKFNPEETQLMIGFIKEINNFLYTNK